jgi:hypothetical protein
MNIGDVADPRPCSFDAELPLVFHQMVNEQRRQSGETHQQCRVDPQVRPGNHARRIGQVAADPFSQTKALVTGAFELEWQEPPDAPAVMENKDIRATDGALASQREGR